MNTRLQQFLAAENISQSVFADTIGVARASVSHILAGRNKPGFEFIESMGRCFPALNLEWLITGKGKMYKGEQSKISEHADSEAIPDLFSPLPELETVAEPSPQPAPSLPKENTLGKQSKTINNQRAISRIIVLYSDGSYQELK